MKYARPSPCPPARLIGGRGGPDWSARVRSSEVIRRSSGRSSIRRRCPDCPDLCSPELLIRSGEYVLKKEYWINHQWWSISSKESTQVAKLGILANISLPESDVRSMARVEMQDIS